MGNKKATGFLCLRLVPCFAYVGAEDNRKGIPFVKIVSLLCKLIQFLMVALSVTVHKALILLVFLNHPYQSLAFRRFWGLTTTLTLSGCLDTTTAPELETTLADVLSGARELILDLRDIEYISSAGLRVLLKAQKSMCDTNGAMKLRNVPEAVLEVFDITGFSEFLTIEA